ncbi:MAG: response regulator [Nitrospirae bacterium]|nr:MAG: response regulator [Nitrospirota bacterium]
MASPPPRTIFLVEDDPAMLSLMERFLRRHGYETAAAADGPTALGEIAARRPDLVIVDYMLPGPFNGLELITRLRDRFPRLPTLFITAFGSPNLCKTAQAGGATACLIKPFNMELLVRQVAALLDAEEGGEAP